MDLGRSLRSTFCIMTVYVMFPVVSLPQVHSFRHFTTRDGLPSNHVTALRQDSRGYIWAGTSDGLAIFDGREFHTYTQREGLSHPIVSDVAEDRMSPGIFWVATGDGLLRFDGSRFSTVFDRPGSADTYIDALCQDHTGRIWFASKDTVMVLEHGIVRAVPVPLPYKAIGQILESGDSLLWFSHGTGILRYNERTGVFSSLEAGRFSDHGWRPMCKDSGGNVWVHRLSDDTTSSTIIRFRGTEAVERRRMPPHRSLMFLVEDGRGGLLSNGKKGVDRLLIDDPSSVLTPFLGPEQGLPEFDLRSGLVDREGNFWTGGNALGLSVLTDWSVLRIPLEGAESGHRRSVAISDLHDHLWVVARDGLHEIVRESDTRWSHFVHRLRPNAVSVALDRHGNLWLAFSDAALRCYTTVNAVGRPSRLIARREFLPGRDFPSGFPVTFCVDPEDVIWYALSGRGVVRIDQRATRPAVTLLGPVDGIPDNYVCVFHPDSRGRLWCGSYQDGLRVLDRRHPSPAKTVTLSNGDQVRALHEDSLGRIWCGLRSGGVAIIDHDSTIAFGVREGLPSGSVRFITGDHSGRVWLGTGYGAVRIEEVSPLRVYAKATLASAPVFAAGCLSSGLLWFLTVEGVTVFDPAAESDRPPPADVQITGMTVNGVPQESGQEVTVPYGQTHCTIEFISPSYRDGEGIRYRYRMAPGDEHWQGPFPDARVVFGSLRPGRHQFQVEAVNSWGIASVRPATLMITVETPFWEKGWFLLLALILGGGAIAGTLRTLEMRKVRRRIAALEQARALEKERLRIARDMHDEIGSTLTEISILGELGREADGAPAKIHQTMAAMAEKSREALGSIGEIIWAIDPRNDELENFAAYIRRFALRICDHAGLHCRLDIPENRPDVRLSAEQRRDLFLVLKEALNNVIKHSGATEVTLRLTLENDAIMLEIADNGRGFDPTAVDKGGAGLMNMRHRAEEIGGTFSLLSDAGSGARVRVYLKRGIAGTVPVR